MTLVASQPEVMIPQGILTPANTGTVYEHDEALTKYLLFADEHQALLDQTVVDRVKEGARNTAAAVGVTADSPGVFESIWVAGTALAAQTDRPLLAAGLVTAGAFALEVGGAFGASRLLAREKGEKAMRWVHKSLGKLGLKGQVETSLVTDSAMAFAFGSPVVAVRRQALNPEISEQERRRYGLKTALIATAIGAPANVAVAEGLHDIIPGKVAVGALAVAGLFALRSRIAKRFQGGSPVAEQSNDGAEVTEHHEARYDLPDEELSTIERGLTERVRSERGRTLTAVWLKHGSAEANFIRTKEAQKFPDINIPGLFGPYDDKSIFLAMVDTRLGTGKGRIIRGTRITGRQFAVDDPDGSDDDSGMAMIRDLAEDGQITQEAIADYYRARGIDVANCISVETNFKIGERSRRKFGFIPMSQLAYLAMYEYVLRHNVAGQDAAIFAHINDASDNSLRRLGVDFGPIAGRSDLRTPAGPGAPERYDDKFTPVALLNTPATAKAMRRLLKVAPTELYM